MSERRYAVHIRQPDGGWKIARRERTQCAAINLARNVATERRTQTVMFDEDAHWGRAWNGSLPLLPRDDLPSLLVAPEVSLDDVWY